jgi:hypothetical protein
MVGMARKRKVGRKRKHMTLDSKARMRALRARKIPQSESQVAWDRYLKTLGLGMERGMDMPDAPSGKGELLTGGMDFDQLSGLRDRM